MAVNDNFIPELWSASILDVMDKALRYAQPGVINQDYEGEINQAGDTVRITAVGDVTVSNYTVGSDMSAPEQLATAQSVLVVDQQKYASVYIDDVDAAQMNVDLRMKYAERIAYGLAKTKDQYVSSLMGTAVPTANSLGSVSSAKSDLGTAGKAYDYIIDLGVLLDENDTPADGRWLIAPPWFVGLLKQDPDIVATGSEAADSRMLNGVVARIGGFDIIMSNTVPYTTTSTEFRIIAGHPAAFTFANQITQLEAHRMEARFGQRLNALEVYGGKAIQPRHLAMLVADKA